MALASLSNTAARFVEGVQSALGMPPDHQKSIKKNVSGPKVLESRALLVASVCLPLARADEDWP